MKELDRTLFEEFTRVIRKFVVTGDKDILCCRTDIAEKISSCVFGSDKWWLSFCALFDSLCGVAPIKNCTNDEIETILRLLDIKVVDKF